MAEKNLQQQKKPEPPPVPAVEKSKIIGAEWFMVILALVFLDIIQIIFTALAVPSAGVTELLNFFIDLFIGPSLILYFYFRGVKLDWKVMVGICAAWFGETIPIVEALPLWSLDAGYVWFLEKSKEGGIFGMGSSVVTAVVAKKVAKPNPTLANKSQGFDKKQDAQDASAKRMQEMTNRRSAQSQGLNAPPPIPTHEYNPLEQKQVVARDVKQIKQAGPKAQEPRQDTSKVKNKLEGLGLEVDDSGYQKRMAEKNNAPKEKNNLSDEKFVGQNRRLREDLDEEGEYRGSRVG